MSSNAFMSITTMVGKQVERKTIGNIKEEDIDLASYKKGLYILQVVDGTENQRIKFIKE
jgi:hypothetical protein